MKNPSHTLRRHLRRRAGQRGAAMVEGIIVVSTMLVFMGLTVFTRKSYGMKLDLQQSTRANTLFYASHGCEGAANGASPTAGGTATGGSSQAENAANKSSLPNKAAASRSWNSASATAADTASWTAVWDNNATGGKSSINTQKHNLGRPISAGSKSTCNEKKYANQWTAWLQFGIDFVARGGGAVDLFR